MADYQADLLKRYGNRQLLVLLARNPDRMDWQHADCAIRWQRVADIAERIGSTRGGRGWRTSAMRMSAAPLQQTLADFIHYLEQRGVSMDNTPVSDAEIATAATAGLLIERLNRLLDAAIRAAPGFMDATRSQDARGPVWLWRVMRSAVATELNGGEVASDQGGYDALSFDPLDEDGEPGNPGFTAGVWFDKPPEAVRDALSSETARQVFESNHIDVKADRSQVGLVFSYRLKDLVGGHTTFEAQAAELGTWAARSVVLIHDLLADIA